MDRRILLTLSLIISCLFSVSCQRTETNAVEAAKKDGWYYFGVTEVTTGQPVSFASIKGGESNVILTGKIEKVCAKKGCWMMISDGTNEQFVRFQNYGFFVPRNAAGREVALRGRSEMQTTSVEDLQHQAQDAGKNAEEIAAITEPETFVIFYADTVYIQGDGLDEPYKPGDEIDPSEDECAKEEGEEKEDADTTDSESEGDDQA